MSSARLLLSCTSAARAAFVSAGCPPSVPFASVSPKTPAFCRRIVFVFLGIVASGFPAPSVLLSTLAHIAATAPPPATAWASSASRSSPSKSSSSSSPIVALWAHCVGLFLVAGATALPTGVALDAVGAVVAAAPTGAVAACAPSCDFLPSSFTCPTYLLQKREHQQNDPLSPLASLPAHDLAKGKNRLGKKVVSALIERYRESKRAGERDKVSHLIINGQQSPHA